MAGLVLGVFPVTDMGLAGNGVANETGAGAEGPPAAEAGKFGDGRIGWTCELGGADGGAVPAFGGRGVPQPDSNVRDAATDSTGHQSRPPQSGIRRFVGVWVALTAWVDLDAAEGVACRRSSGPEIMAGVL